MSDLNPKDRELSEDFSLACWDRTAKLWDRITTTGEDYYRTAFFGPLHLEACGDVRGLRVLDVGCGSGYFSRLLAERGAEAVGIDWSEQMIELARHREDEQPLGIVYRQMDAREVDQHFEIESFDLVTGCMSFMDIADPTPALSAAARVMKAAGRLVMCNIHPIQTTAVRQWATDANGKRIGLTVGGYFTTDRFYCEWGEESYGEKVAVVQHHFTIGRWFEMIEAAGLRIVKLDEPRATEAMIAAQPQLAGNDLVPFPLLMELKRADGI